MTKYSKFNPIYRLQKWLDSVPGQTFMNYAYSWGAAIVIAGALFKLTHLPGANFWLFLGMGTEIFVFFISGFDRPFSKTEDGKELPTHVRLDDDEPENEVVTEGGEPAVAAVAGGPIIGGPIIGGGGGIVGGGSMPAGDGSAAVGEGSGIVGGGGVIGGGIIGGGGGGGTIIIGGGGGTGEAVEGGEAGEAGETVITGGGAGVAGVPGGTVIGGVVAPELPELNPDMEEATNNYVEKLKTLTDTLEKVAEQSQRLTRDSEEMENLNRTLTGICKVYEMQLKGASQQIGTIDEINDQTRKMADQIAELNRIYARMIEAMTVNMPKVNASELNV